MELPFDLPPKEAIAWFQAKGLRLNPDTWAAIEASAHEKSFTVAHLASLDILQSIFDEIDKAISNGTTFKDFQDTLEPLMQKAGWWGVDENGVQLGCPHRLATIFRTNIQSAYMKGRVDAMRENAEDRPWWEYVAVMDSRTRLAHAKLNGKVWRYDNPIWSRITPPQSWNCRCRISALDDAAMERRGITPDAGSYYVQEVEVNGYPQPQTVYRDPLTGEETKMDAGWGYDRSVGWKPDPAGYDPSLQGYVSDL